MIEIHAMFVIQVFTQLIKAALIVKSKINFVSSVIVQAVLSALMDFFSLADFALHVAWFKGVSQTNAKLKLDALSANQAII